jgi:hypothetical protein
MKALGLIAALAGLITAPLRAAVPVAAQPATPAAVKQDVRCFMLFATAVNDADKAGNAKAREATGLAVMYFFAKLGVEAPGLNIPDAVMVEANELVGNPKAKEYGAACDSEFQQRAKDLIGIGQQLQNMSKASAQSSSSS